MPTENPRLVVIVGSVREGRFGPTVARWFTDTAAQVGRFDLDVIDLADYSEQELGGLAPRLTAADAFVVVTPEYNHSYPSFLKTAIDKHSKPWQAKPVGFVCYGGVSGGLRAVEHLRGVFAELHAVTVRDTVSFHNAGSAFEPDGTPKDQTGPSAAAKTLLDQLAWWATALSEARARSPYGA